jgi:oligopeptide/dipeptide ABC transporter ATP-binding protein
MKTLVSVRDLKVWFPVQRGVLRRTVAHVRAVDGVSFEIGAGQTVALVGESGSGKTTVGRAMIRLIPATSGQVSFDGRDVFSLSKDELHEVRRRVAMVFQDPMTALDPKMRVLDIVAEGMDAFRLTKSRTEREAKVIELLERVQLGREHLERFPHEFSGGQRQRIGIARALAVNPDLIVCDEAVSALDVSIQAQVLNLLSDLQKELGVAYLFITHDLSVVRHLASHVLVMYLGRIVEQGPKSEVFDQPLHPYTKALLDAAPGISHDPARPRQPLRGETPSPVKPPSGCPFHPRCPMAVERCSQEVPSPRKIGERLVSCHLVEAQSSGGSS